MANPVIFRWFRFSYVRGRVVTVVATMSMTFENPTSIKEYERHAESFEYAYEFLPENSHIDEGLPLGFFVDSLSEVEGQPEPIDILYYSTV